MTRTLLLVGLLIAGVLATRSEAADPPRSRAATPGGESTTILLRRCTMDYEQSTMLGAPNIGVLQDCLVQPGDRIEANQVVGRLQDREAQAELDLRVAQAASDIEIRLAEAKHTEALTRFKRAVALDQRKFISSEEFELKKLEVTSAALEAEDARFRHQLAQLQARQAEAAVHAREIVAPHAGVVVAVLKKAGEPVTGQGPVFQIVDTDRIWVTGYLDVHDAWRVAQGRPVRVTPEVGGADLAIEERGFLGRIVFVNSGVDLVSQTCKVVAEVDNREGLLRAGLKARMEILPMDPMSAAAVTTGDDPR
jgi:RND family efflux transporter MFP subunit